MRISLKLAVPPFFELRDLMPLCVWSSWHYIETRLRGYYALLLVLLTGMIGVFIALDLFKVNRGEVITAEVVAAVLAGERIDGIRPEFAVFRGFGDRFMDLLAHQDLVGSDRSFYLEGRHTGILADRSNTFLSHIDVDCNSFKGER